MTLGLGTGRLLIKGNLLDRNVRTENGRLFAGGSEFALLCLRFFDFFHW